MEDETMKGTIHDQITTAVPESLIKQNIIIPEQSMEDVFDIVAPWKKYYWSQELKNSEHPISKERK